MVVEDIVFLLLCVAQVLLIALKLGRVIAWSWWLVFVPGYILVLMALVLMALITFYVLFR